MKFSPWHRASAFNHFHSIFTVSITFMSSTVFFSIILPCLIIHTFLQGNTFGNEFWRHLFRRYAMITDDEDYISTDSGCTGWSKSLCAPDDFNTESYKQYSKCPPPVSRHLLTHRTVFSKTVFSIARSTFRLYSVMAIFNSSIVCTETFWSPCITEC